MTVMTPAHAESGFSLVEMLVALGLLGLLGLMLTTGLAAVRIDLQKSERARRTEAVASAQTYLRARIEQVFPLAEGLDQAGRVSFACAAKQLDFVAPPPLAEGPGPLRRYRLLLSGAGDLTLRSANLLGREGAAPQSVILLKNVMDIDIDCFGASSLDPEGHWQARWEQRQRPPDGVRVRLRFHPGDPREWPDLVARPSANLDSACALEPSTGRCRGRQ